MKNTIRISVGIATLISAAALAHAQTERPSPQGGATSESRTLGQDRATETLPSQQGAEQKGAAAGQRGGQALEEKAERNAAAARQGAEERNGQPGMKQGAEQQGSLGERRTTQGRTSEQERERAGQSGVGVSEQGAAGATEQGKATGAAEEGKAAEQRAQHGQQQLGAEQGAQERANTRQGAATPAGPGGQATRQQPMQGQARAQGSVSPVQQARIRDTLRNSSAARVGHVDFGLNVGAVVPRSERLAVLPGGAVSIAPQFRGYKYLIVEDEIVIVDPRTYRVAAVIPEAGFESGGPGPTPGGLGPHPGGPCG